MQKKNFGGLDKKGNRRVNGLVWIMIIDKWSSGFPFLFLLFLLHFFPEALSMMNKEKGKKRDRTKRRRVALPQVIKKGSCRDGCWFKNEGGKGYPLQSLLILVLISMSRVEEIHDLFCLDGL